MMAKTDARRWSIAVVAATSLLFGLFLLPAGIAPFGNASAAPPIQIVAKVAPGIALGQETNVTVNVTGGPAADAPEHERNYSLKAWVTGDELEGTSPLVGTPFSQNNSNGSFVIKLKAPSKKASLTLVMEALSKGGNGSSESARKELSLRAVNPITIKVVIDNKGDVTAKNVSVAFYLDDSFIGDRVVAEVPANNRTNVSFEHAPPELAPGRHEVRIVLDPKGQMVEFEEGNNVLRHEFFVHEEPANTQWPFILLIAVWLVGMVAVASRARKKKEK